MGDKGVVITGALQPVENKTVEAAVAMGLQKVVIECSASCYTETGRLRINIWIDDLKLLKHAGSHCISGW